MKTAGKTIALLMSAILVFSAFALISSATEENRKTVNVQVTAPVVGEEAEFTIKVDDGYIPGQWPYLYLETGLITDNPEGIYKEYGKFLSPEECANFSLSNYQGNKYLEASSGFLKQIILNGIQWIEYDKSDVETLNRLKPETTDLSKIEVVTSYLLQASKEYDCSFVDVIGEEGQGYSSCTRYMLPGDTFKKDKLYMCWCQVFADIENELTAYGKAVNALMPYYESKGNIDKELENASEDEVVNLNKQLDLLKNEYRDKFNDFDTALNSLTEAYQNKAGEDALNNTITVNGETTEKNNKSVLFSSYDFGEAAEKPEEKMSFIDMIKAFFSNIIEFFKNLFSRFFVR